MTETLIALVVVAVGFVLYFSHMKSYNAGYKDGTLDSREVCIMRHSDV